jgi:hypothetical protein
MSKLLERKVTVRHLVFSICASIILSFGLANAAQPNMQAALAALRNARRSLIDATPDKGGHRANAIKLTDQAIAETQAGMAMH